MDYDEYNPEVSFEYGLQSNQSSGEMIASSSMWLVGGEEILFFTFGAC